MDHSERLGIERPLATQPQVIVVGSEDQHLVGEARIGTREERGHIASLHCPWLYGGSEERAVAALRGLPDPVGCFAADCGHGDTQGRPRLSRQIGKLVAVAEEDQHTAGIAPSRDRCLEVGLRLERTARWGPQVPVLDDDDAAC